MIRLLSPLLLLSLCMTLMLSCDSSEQSGMNGVLYFVSGGYVGSYDLEAGTSSIVANLGDATIRDVASTSGENLLLIVESKIGDREVSLLTSFDPTTNKKVDLIHAIAMAQLGDSDRIAFDNGWQLLVGTVRGGVTNISLISDHPQRDINTIVAISHDQMLFESGKGAERKIFLHSDRTAKVVALDELTQICKLSSAVWVGNFEQLACRKKNDNSTYTFVTLGGVVEREYSSPDDNVLEAVTYISRYQTLVFTELREDWASSTRQAAIRSLNLQNGETRLLSEDQYLGRSAVYRQH